MAHVVVLATGGTIASADASGGAVATRNVNSLLGGGRTGEAPDITVEGRDALHTNSFLLTHRDLRVIAEAVVEENARGDVDGIVVTHGTDTLEETSFLIDPLHHGDKPVVFTGAQRAADDPAPDGPGSLRQALAAATSPATQGLGVLVSFAGYLYPARGGVRPTPSTAPPSDGPTGHHREHYRRPSASHHPGRRRRLPPRCRRRARGGGGRRRLGRGDSRRDGHRLVTRHGVILRGDS